MDGSIFEDSRVCINSRGLMLAFSTHRSIQFTHSTKMNLSVVVTRENRGNAGNGFKCFISDQVTVLGSAQQHQVNRSSQIFLGPSTSLLFFVCLFVCFFLPRGHHINLGGTKWETIYRLKKDRFISLIHASSSKVDYRFNGPSNKREKNIILKYSTSPTFK